MSSTSREKVTPPPSPLQRMKHPFIKQRLSPGPVSFRARGKKRIGFLILAIIVLVSVLNELRCAKYGCTSRMSLYGGPSQSRVGGGAVLPTGWKYRSGDTQAVGAPVRTGDATKETGSAVLKVPQGDGGIGQVRGEMSGQMQMGEVRFGDDDGSTIKLSTNHESNTANDASSGRWTDGVEKPSNPGPPNTLPPPSQQNPKGLLVNGPLTPLDTKPLPNPKSKPPESKPATTFKGTDPHSPFNYVHAPPKSLGHDPLPNTAAPSDPSSTPPAANTSHSPFSHEATDKWMEHPKPQLLPPPPSTLHAPPKAALAVPGQKDLVVVVPGAEVPAIRGPDAVLGGLGAMDMGVMGAA